ncbi:MAG: hypothetical protein KTR20_02545 [Cellvibrionaceae bacterium]|nr:hypothetical protein [Cellvibrionaceae bacterium]
MSGCQQTLNASQKKTAIVGGGSAVGRRRVHSYSRSSCILLGLLLALLYGVLVNDWPIDRPVVEKPVAIIDVRHVLMNRFAGLPFNGNDATDISAVNFIDILADEKSVSENKQVLIYEMYNEGYHQKKIDSLLVEADVLFRMDRLTSPEFDNAYERYRTVIRFDKNNQQAMKGIKKIVDRYLSLTDLVIAKKEYHKVPALVQNAVDVGEDYFDMSTVLSRYKDYFDADNVFVKSFKQAALVDDGGALDESQYKSVAAVDSEIFQVAMRRVGSNDKAGAIKILTVYDALVEQWGDAQELLLQLLLSQQQLSEAEQLLARYSQLTLVALSEKAAKIIAYRGGAANALALLSSHAVAMADHREYYALMAALYYQLAQYQQAIDLYKQLLNSDVDNARYWLGLAVSLAAVESADAIEAFRFVQQLAVDDSLVKRYLTQRLMAGF